jgi:predicted nucleic acid-binding protein
MPVQYTINADVIDLRNDIPRQDDLFLVDSNVWYWTTYSRADLAFTCPKAYQINDYPLYISKALSAKSKLLRCGLSLAELAHLIEKTEREIYTRAHGAITSKEYRHNYPAERANVVAEVQAVWSQVKTMAQTIEVQIDEILADAALSRLSTQQLDGYDLFILEAIAGAGIVKVITDDGDYVTVPGLQVFTANQNVIAAAQNQSKLLKR